MLYIRATASEMGPLMLSRILSLNETQSDILTVLFKIADDEELLLAGVLEDGLETDVDHGVDVEGEIVFVFHIVSVLFMAEDSNSPGLRLSEMYQLDGRRQSF